MKRLLVVSALLAAGILIAAWVAATLVEPRSLIEPGLQALSEQLGRPVEVETLDFSLFPTPTVHAAALTIAGRDANSPPLLEVERVGVRVAILPLFLGRIVLSALEIDSPRIHLELDEAGRPVLPGAAPRPVAREGIAQASTGTEVTTEGEEDSAVLLAVQSIRIRDGALRAGPWRIEKLELRGRLRQDRSASLSFDVDLPGLALLRNVEIDATEVLSPSRRIDATLEVREADLGKIVRRLAELGVGSGLSAEGRLDGPLSFTLQSGQLIRGGAELTARSLRLSQSDLTLSGDATLDAQLPGPWKLDLSASEIVAPGGVRKAAGIPAHLAGEIGPDLRTPGEMLLTLGPNRVPFQLELDDGPPILILKPTALELEPLAELSEALTGATGRIEIEPWRITLDPLRLDGTALLSDVALALPHGRFHMSGSLRGEGRRLLSHGLQLRIADQSARLGGSYDLVSGELSVDGELSGAQVEALAQAFTGSQDLMGLLDASFTLRGAPELAKLSGIGRFSITEGRIRGFALLDQLLGDLAALPVLVAQLKGKDLSRFEEEEFQLLSADVRLRNAKLETQNLVLRYEHSTAYLYGSIGIDDGTLNLAGRVEISEEVDAALSGEAQGKVKLIPITAITGTLSRPRLRVDARALAGLAATYTGQGRIRDELEEKLGKEGAEAVDEFLQRILRGGR